MASLRQRQRGAAAIEFALLFILFFVLFYAIVSYSLAMLLMQGLTHAAEEGVRATIAVDRLAYPTPSEYAAAVEETARQRTADALSWLPTKARQQIIDGNNITARLDGNLVSMTVAYPNYVNNGLAPTLNIPLIGPVPRLPSDLVGRASLQI